MGHQPHLVPERGHRPRRARHPCRAEPDRHPRRRDEIPLVVQDRQFNADGTLLYPTSGITGATWIGEYFGDVMLVNGKV